MSKNISEYTPTWRVSEFVSRQLGNALIEDELGKGVAEVYGKRELALVRANLMAAAPDLLESCQRLVELAEPNIYPKPDKPDSDWGILQAARAAIAKATGDE